MAGLGIVGVGELAEFVLRGLRRAGDDRPVSLSPRNAARAARLAQDCGATLLASNQAVLDAANLILVAVPPKDVYGTLEALAWQNRHVVICVAIDVTCAGLQEAAPHATIARAMPSSCLALNRGATPIFPAEPQTEALFATIGDIAVLESEAQFETASALAAYYLWSFAVMDAVAERAITEGLPPVTARRLTAALTAGAAAIGAEQPEQPLRTTLDRYALPGTMTLQGLEKLRAEGGIAAWETALDLAIMRMRQGA
ncbi:MAG TPA: NAD(P)-binding domain-containing protein [Dongiaceae bacterium]|nr:NAD(P)-binding domain-containing protein [Dongiaceae bacterium]